MHVEKTRTTQGKTLILSASTWRKRNCDIAVIYPNIAEAVASFGHKAAVTVWPHALIWAHGCICITCTPSKHIRSAHSLPLPRWWAVEGFIYFPGFCLDCCCQLGLVTWGKPAAQLKTLSGFYAVLLGAHISFAVWIKDRQLMAFICSYSWSIWHQYLL